MAGRLAGMRALITGASSGIGEATAWAFVAEGVVSLALVGRRADALEALAGSLGGDVAFALPCDVADDAAVASMVASAWDRMGGIDVAVHSAGVSNLALLADLTPARWRDVIDINLSGAFYVCREVGLRMREVETGGAIVTVASDSALLGEAAFVAYCASKGGLVAMTRALAAELLPNVRVNAVLPGAIDTPMVRRDVGELDDPEGAMREIEARIPMGRLGRADEVAAAIVYLAADATYATGSALSLDGGTTSIIAPFAD